MGILDQRADNWFGICEEFVAKALGKGIQFRRSLDGSSVRTVLWVQAGGGNIRCFNLGERTWDAMEDDDIHVYIFNEGTIEVGYSLEDQADMGMRFKVGHPREVAELFHLLVNPDAYLAADKDVPSKVRKLGDLGEFHVLIPDGDIWRIVDPAALPQGAPDDFRKAFHLNLTRDWDHFLSGATCAAWDFAGRWPEWVKSLPNAAPHLRDGYVLDSAGAMKSSADYAVVPPAGPPGGEVFLQTLFKPLWPRVSSMYLREMINGDKEMAQIIQQAFNTTGELESLVVAIKAIPVNLPENIPDQIRIAAEHNAIRQWLLCVAGRLANQRGCYHTQGERHWHLAQALGEMVDRTQIEE